MRKNRSLARTTKRRLQCEALEDRRVLATFTVTDLGDTSDANAGDGTCADAGGNCTLRAALEEANALAGDDNVDFSVAGSILLSNGALEITSNVSVDGGDAIMVDGDTYNGLTINGIGSPSPVASQSWIMRNGGSRSASRRTAAT